MCPSETPDWLAKLAQEYKSISDIRPTGVSCRKPTSTDIDLHQLKHMFDGSMGLEPTFQTHYVRHIPRSNMLYTETLSKVNQLTSIFNGAGLDFPLVVDQVAVVVRPELLDAAKELLGAMGHKEWTSDNNKAVGTVFGRQSRVEGALHFSYTALNLKPGLDTKGLEFEILVYNPTDLTPVEGLPYDNWHAARARRDNTSEPGMQISHLGYHLPSETALEQVKAVMLGAGFEIAQEVRTVEHSNEFLVESGRKYHYLIFHTRHILGFDSKFIARVQE